GPQQSFPEQEA
nr:Chain I, DQ8.5-glia-gamma1 peptide [Triticum aestivum]5KSB_J Chain J, DQ8.5-glia-gamma1 peptide [Triticum aestivum]